MEYRWECDLEALAELAVSLPWRRILVFALVGLLTAALYGALGPWGLLVPALLGAVWAFIRGGRLENFEEAFGFRPRLFRLLPEDKFLRQEREKVLAVLQTWRERCNWALRHPWYGNYHTPHQAEGIARLAINFGYGETDSRDGSNPVYDAGFGDLLPVLKQRELTRIKKRLAWEDEQFLSAFSFTQVA